MIFNKNLYKSKYFNINLSNYNFLVTGGSGFIGSNIVEYLLKYKAGNVRVIDNLSNGYYENIKGFINEKNFEYIEGDISDYQTCLKAVKGIDFIFHQAALGSVPRSLKDPISTNNVNVSGFLNLFVSAKDERSVKKIVYASSSSIYGDSNTLPKIEDNVGNSLSPYGLSKFIDELYAELFSKLYNLPSIGLRYFNVFGPKQNPNNPYAAVIPLFLKSAKNKKQPIIYGDGLTSRDFTFVENVIQANMRAMFTNINDCKHDVFNIACGNSITLNSLWKSISKLHKVEYIYPIYKEERPGDIKHSFADISKAKSLINYSPKIDLIQGLKLIN